MWGRTSVSVVLFLAATLFVVMGAAQDMPAPDAEPVDATQDIAPAADVRMEEYSVQGTDGRPKLMQRSIRAIPKGYRSPTLRGEFLAQWMYIVQRGRIVNFWGARITRLDPDSPLRMLGVRPGDVITRLDGIPIWQGMYREGNGPWQIVELERHYGSTEVRYIQRNAQQVRVGEILLDGYFPDDSDNGIAPIEP